MERPRSTPFLRAHDAVTTLFLIRHAHHDWLGRALAGWTPGIHLNEAGRAAAAALAHHLSSEPIAAIYTSPLERATETAQAIAAPHGFAPRVSRALGEIDFGAWTGHVFSDLDGRADWRLWNERRTHAVPPGGETILHVQERILGELARLRALHPDQTIVVVSHGDVLKAVLLGVIEGSLDRMSRIDLDPASISVLRWDASGPCMASWNGVGALAAARLERQA